MLKNAFTVESTSISQAWLDVFKNLLHPKVEGLVSLTVSIQIGPDHPLDDTRVKTILDDALLKRKGLFKTSTTANTIFPPLWNPQVPRSRLYERYERTLPHLKCLSSWNYNGMYFERLIRFDAKVGDGQMPVNQLEHIINTYCQGNHRRTALQASIFDPRKDHTNQRRRGFPCLQHVIFLPDGKGNLTVMGIYAKQHIFDRAYGNYLGLYNLGIFMAHEMGLTLTGVNCFSSLAELGKISKHEGQELYDQIQWNIN